MSLLQIEQVSKLYPAGGFGGGMTPALRSVSFDIAAGEVVTLIGESGSGKTTLGRVVLRLTRASSGRVIFDGQDVSLFGRPQLREYYRHAQGVFQDPFSSYNPVYKADRVFELLRGVYFGGMPRSDWDTKIESALHGVSLNPSDVLDKYPHQLSGGQLQRLLIARALLLDVKLLIADEIISMLDASTRVDVLNLLVSLKRSGLAILFITHDLSLGNYISDRTVILRRGAIVEAGPTVAVFTRPQHSYTKMLLDSVPQLHSKWRRGSRAAAFGGSDPARAADVLATPGAARPVRRNAMSPLAVLSRRGPDLAPSAPALVEREPGHLVAEEA